MQAEWIREAREWLQRAERDLAAGEALTISQPALPEMVAYHAQQAGEKSLKAFLAVHDRAFPLTHNLNVLLTLCEEFDADLATLATAAQVLTPFATAFRYPGGPLAPPLKDAEEALKLARGIFDTVRNRIPA